MDTKETLYTVVDEIIKEKSYENEINIFLNYLKLNLLEDKVFKLTTTNIDDYFEYAIRGDKIGSISTSIAHINALKTLINKLDKLGYNNHALLGYLESDEFKSQIKSKLSLNVEKEIISVPLIQSTLVKIDNYIKENYIKKNLSTNKKKNLSKIMVASLYIKLSLVIPIKVSEMLDLKIGNIRSSQFRAISYNGVIIKITNNLRKQIIKTVEYFEEEYMQKYNQDDKLFEFLISKYSKVVTTTNINNALLSTYRKLKIDELLKRKKVGVKEMSIFTPESYKKSAIYYMLRNGVNVVYLKKLTGLDISTLIGDFNLEENITIDDVISVDINKALITTDYYTYL
ncbi:hypothetical protein LI058_05205 [Clostridium perfringens]|uniref:hypothetical protein n=1 Tax=Clostridium perfringens TaxID=1502 RepID=UPI0010D62339|nr:hypothetical protein [Clostridium perfringens]EGT0692696.1 hypothetical protein [Clostridium perfringens]EHK2347765.1 hypothetical protein [Clostridium perfringens]MCX0358265.1 hypothetical protein [Clostridium perfringens]MCX0372876.1 hypothetical protein [Clostridium perfringens]MCX0406692.1 hypothetical protein [Clostridium perfringens]